MLHVVHGSLQRDTSYWRHKPLKDNRTAGSIYHRTLLRLLFPVRMQKFAHDFRYDPRIKNSDNGQSPHTVILNNVTPLSNKSKATFSISWTYIRCPNIYNFPVMLYEIYFYKLVTYHTLWFCSVWTTGIVFVEHDELGTSDCKLWRQDMISRIYFQHPVDRTKCVNCEFHQLWQKISIKKIF